MERYWTKKRIGQLLAADAEALDRWLDDFAPAIYTGLYFQTGANAELAAELTGKTFCAAIGNLPSFNPASEAMYHWIKDQAKETRDDVLTARQLKPQRPWAWSQLPDEVLCAIAHFRSEQLPEEVANNVSVQELTRAALVELSHADRELVKHRYNHLDTPEHIAEETGESIEQINDRLYRCRHFFRRVLVQLVQSENNGFAESAATGEMEQLDFNMEKLLSATAMYQPISNPHFTVIRDSVTQTARTAAATHKQNGQTRHPVLLAATVGIIVLVVLVGIFVMSHLAKEPTPTEPTEPQTVKSTEDAAEQTSQRIDNSEIDQEELQKTLLAGGSGDIDTLVEILKTGQEISQLAAANFLGRLGDESTIGLLEEAEQQWYPDGPDDNVFAKAIIQIENRLLAESGEMVETPEEETVTTEVTETDAKPDTPEPPTPPAPTVGLTGTVATPEQAPIVDARIVLSQNPLMSPTANRNILGRSRTDEQGQYAFDREIDGPVFVDCSTPPGPNRPMLNARRSLLCQKQTSYTIDFGGSPVIAGTLEMQSGGSDNQILYLSDAMDPADAAFRSEAVTDNSGRFAFPGVPAGNYYLLYNTSDNRIVRLDTTDVQDRDVTNWTVSTLDYELTVQYDLPEGSPVITEAALKYGSDVSDEFQQYDLISEDANTFFANAPEGSYTLVTSFSNDMHILQDIELATDQTMTVGVPEGTATLVGRFISPSPLDLYLDSNDGLLRFDLISEENGLYAVPMVPGGTYSLTAVVNGLPVTFMEIDLEDDRRQVLDIDPGQLIQSFSPLYVIVADEAGNLINNAQVWLTGDGDVITTHSTGRGAFLAAPAGEYSLHAAYPSRPAVEENVTISQDSLLADPNPGNTVILTIP